MGAENQDRNNWFLAIQDDLKSFSEVANLNYSLTDMSDNQLATSSTCNSDQNLPDAFQARIPIKWENQNIGYLKLSPKVPNHLSVLQFEQLVDLAKLALKQALERAEIEKRCEQTQAQYQKQSEELHLETLLFDALLENTSDNVYFKDLDSRFIRSSRAQSYKFNLSDPKETRGKTDFDFFTDEHARGAWNDEQRIIKEGVSISKEEKETWPDRPDTWVSTTKAPLRDYDGKIIGTFGISRDITERVEQERIILQQNEELQELNKHKDKLMSIIAHDLRSPFNSFLGLTEILDKQIATMSAPEIKQMASTIRNSATRIYDLLSNLLEWTRLQRGQINASKMEFLLDDIVTQSIDALQEIAFDKKIGLSVSISEGLTVFADPYMLQIIIHNLLTNALKFTAEGGQVSLEANRNEKGNSHIAIRDTGIGMPNSLIAHLFQLDGHANRPGTKGESSTGLGLLVCKEFADKQGAKLWVESQEGKGTIFHLEIYS
jgi:PAS domain S-box-containing protein